MSFGEDLRAARHEAGLSRDQLAENAGISLSFVKKLEQGTVGARPGTIGKLEQALGVQFVMADDNGKAETQEPLFTKDKPPTPTKKAATRRTSSKAVGIPLAKQLELPYMLGSNALVNRLPATSRVLAQQARPCAEAWDQFLLRYPALREKIEQGMIAGDVVGLIMAHVPILQVAREELAAINAAQNPPSYDGGVGAGQAA